MMRSHRENEDHLERSSSPSDWLAAEGAEMAPRAAARRAAASEIVRDTVLRSMAHRFFPCVPVTTQAERIHDRIQDFAAANWMGDSAQLLMPDSYRGTQDEYLWMVFKSGAPMRLGVRSLRRILIGAESAANAEEAPHLVGRWRLRR